MTRSPDSRAARELAGLGVELVRADMADPGRMRNVCDGTHGVFSVQNPMIGGEHAEFVQGRNVVDPAADAGVSHLVYGSAGTPSTGVAAWDVNFEVAEYARSRGLPLTVLRPMAFMELMTDKDLYPPVAAWQLMPRLVGAERPIPGSQRRTLVPSRLGRSPILRHTSERTSRSLPTYARCTNAGPSGGG